MKTVFVVFLAACLGGCNTTIPLPEVAKDDPLFQLNTDRVQSDINHLTQPKGDGQPIALPAPQQVMR